MGIAGLQRGSAGGEWIEDSVGVRVQRAGKRLARTRLLTVYSNVTVGCDDARALRGAEHIQAGRLRKGLSS